MLEKSNELTYPELERVQFRVWDRANHQMINKAAVTVRSQAGVVGALEKGSSSGLVNNPFVHQFDIDWYTGATDVYGRNVYMNDFVEWDGLIFLVIWDDVMCGFRLYRPDDDKYIYTPFREGCDWGEVIGNSHENPELLKEVE